MSDQPERIVLDFVGGPFDGSVMGWLAEDHVRLPEDLYCAWGSYHLHLVGEQYSGGARRLTSRFVYDWTEGGDAA